MVEIPQLGFFKKAKLEGTLPKIVVYSLTGVCVSVFLLLFVLSLFGLIDLASPVDFIVFALLSGTGIYGMYEWMHYRRIFKIDSIFPDFVRDLAASRRAGMTFTNAILFTSKGNYGLLSDEIKRIAQQISWGSSIEDALHTFAARINTPSVNRTISLIIEASRSGGNVAEVLDVAANDAREIKLLEAERRVSMLSYVVVIYVSMMVFMAIIAMLAGVFIPTITNPAAQGLSQTMGSIGIISQADIIQVFYFATLVQSIGTGFVAGIFEDGHLESSVKHIFILVFISWFLFKYVVTM